MQKIRTANLFVVAALCGIGALFVQPASAGIYGDDLSKCLVKSSSTQDKTVLTQWIFAVMSLHPDVKPYSNMTQAQHDELDAKVGALMQRLLTADCRSETVAAVSNEGDSVFETSFGVLGQVAMRNLMSDQAVATGMANLGKYLDDEKLKGIFK